MRNILGTSVLLMGALMLCGASTASAGETAILTAKVPFQFEVHGLTFHPGKYTIEQDDLMPSLLLIRADQGKPAAAFFTTIRDSDKAPTPAHPVLTFKRYEGQYRLEGVWEGDRDGFDISE